MKKDVAVLGAGVCGLHLALAFCEAGYQVKVFSSQKHLPASFASHGLVSHKGYTLPRDDLFANKLEGASGLRKRILFLEKELKSQSSLVDGVYELFRNKEEEQKLRQRIYHRQFTGCFQSEYLSKEKLQKKAKDFFDPKLFDLNPKAAYYYQTSYAFDPLWYLEALKLYLQLKGVCFKEAELLGLEVEGFKFNLCFSDKKRSFSHVLCALGARTESFLKESPFSLPHFRYSSGWTLRSKGPKEYDLKRSFLLGQKNLTFLKNQMIFGSFDKKPSKEQFFDQKDPFLGAFFEPFFESPVFFTGERVYTDSRAPFLECFRLGGDSNLIVLTGMYKSGFSLAEIYAKKALSLF